MTYQVFARKYRPQKFDEVVGQDHITRTLKNAIEQDRLAHAYLFVGPRGTGKTSTARIISKALNCIQGPTTEPCGQCDACREIAAGTSLDVLEIDGASNNGVEQVRELRDNVRFAPTRGKYKIYIIDEVHMLTAAAFNALLKTLEEPPEHVKFIFATTEPQKVLPTILSRCQRFDLRRIPAPLIAGHLKFIASEEKIELADAAADAIAKGAEGGLRDAESMLDQLVAFCGEKIVEQDVLDVFGFTAQQAVSDFCGAILARDTAGALGILDAQAESGKDLSRLITDLLSHLRNLLVFQVDPDSVRAELTQGLTEAMGDQAGKTSTDRLLGLIDLFAATEGRMKWAPNKRLHFEIGVIKAVESLGQASLDQVLETLLAMREGREPAIAPALVPPPARPKPPVLRPKPDPAPAPAPPAEILPEPPPVAKEKPEPPSAAQTPEPAAEPQDPVKLWAALLEACKSKPALRANLQAGAPLEISGDVFHIGFPPDAGVQMDYLLRTSNRGHVEKSLADLAGAPLKIAAEIKPDLVVAPPEEPAPLPDPKEEYMNDPKIKMALEIFKGELIPPK